MFDMHQVVLPRDLYLYCVQEIDRLIEVEKSKDKTSLGTTGKGIGPTYAAKVCSVLL